MGSYRVANLCTEPEKLASLWTRGGLEGVCIYVDNTRIDLPRELILSLVACEYRNKVVSAFEQMSDEEIIERIMRP